MARGKRRVAYRRRHQNRFSLFLVSLVVLMIMVVVAVRSVELQRKIAGYDTQIASLSAQIDAETARAEEIEEYRKYTQTKAMWRKWRRISWDWCMKVRFFLKRTIKQGD